MVRQRFLIPFIEVRILAGHPATRPAQSMPARKTLAFPGLFCLCFPHSFSPDRSNPRSNEGKIEGKKSGIRMAFLNFLRVKKAGPGRHFDGTVPGLCLMVQPSGSRSWVLRLQRSGKRRDLGLGGFPDVGLEEVREKARALRKLAATGADLFAARNKERVIIPTFREAAEACHKARQSGWSTRHADAFLATLELHAYPVLGRLRVDSVDEKDIVAVLSPLWQSKPAAARKIRQRVGVVLDYAKGSGWRTTGAPRDGLRPLLAKQVKAGNFAAVPFEDVPPLVKVLNGGDPTSGRLALLFTILTAARSGETRAARWSEIDMERCLWNRPAARMKGGAAHSVTLSPQAINVLKIAAVKRADSPDPLVFEGSGGRPLSDMTLGKVLRTAGRSETVHGFRSSFRDWAAERMPHIPDPVAEAALAHVVADKVVAAYKRTNFIEMRRELVDAWGQYCSATPKPHQRRKRGPSQRLA